MKSIFLILTLTLLALSVSSNDKFLKDMEVWLTALKSEEVSDYSKSAILKKMAEYGLKPEMSFRYKRQAFGDNSHWCCQNVNERPPTVVYATYVGTRVITTTHYRHECKSGLWSNKCSTTSDQKTHLQYYTYQNQTDYVTIPMGREQCADDKITCCAGLVNFPQLNNCLSATDAAAFMAIFNSIRS